MYDPITFPLLAQNEHAPKKEHEGGPANDHTGSEHTTHGAPGHGPEGKEGTGSVFNELLSELGDHREVSFGPTHLFDLPMIFIDNGFHFYSSAEAMIEEGTYTLNEEHHIALKSEMTQLQSLRAEVHTPKEIAAFKKGMHQPALDMSITTVIFFQWLAMIVMALIFIPMARRYRKAGARPLKGFYNAMEGVLIYVRDQVVLPNTGDDGKKLMPIFLTMFVFILVMNLVGLVPGGHSATGNINVTAGLAIIAFFVIQISSILKNGLVAWLKHLTGGTPLWLWPIMVPVEILGLFTKPFALCVRLFANMTAGHVILLSLIGLVFVAQTFIPVTIGFSLFINILELLVAFIQAYIFTTLMAVFTGMGMESHDHGDDHGSGDHAAAH